MQLLDDKDLRATGRQQMVIGSPDKPVIMSEWRKICKSDRRTAQKREAPSAKGDKLPQ
jgi:hypothetical protein